MKTKEAITLIRPGLCHVQAVEDYRREFIGAGEKDHMDGCSGLEHYPQADAWLKAVQRRQSRETCPAGDVDADLYLACRVRDGYLLGMIDFRHHIDHPVLGRWGGHIGYSVRPTQRRQGYAEEMLRQLLPLCREQGLKKVMITCKEDNPASQRVILACGGDYESTVFVEALNCGVKRYWISL